MEIGILGTSDTLFNKNNEFLLNNSLTHYLLLDKPHQKIVPFLKKSPVIIMDIKEKNQLYGFVRRWSVFHKKGLLILRRPIELGIADRIDQWLKQNGKEIEVLVFPCLSSFLDNHHQPSHLVLGGNPFTHYTTQFRRFLIDQNHSLFLTSRKEAEFILFLFHSYVLIQKAFWIELEQRSEQLGLDIETIKKGIPNAFNSYLFHHIIPCDILKSFIPSKEELNDINKSIIHHAADMVIMDRQWMTDQVQSLFKLEPIQTIAIWGADDHTVQMLTALDVQKIQIYSAEDSSRIFSSKIKYCLDPYMAAENAELLLILAYHEKLASISLSRLAEKMAKKKIIDQVNLFEQTEMESLDWFYISKGRKKVPEV